MNINSLDLFKRTFDQSTFRILYYRYKEYIPYAATMLVAIALFLGFIIPQMQQWFFLKSQTEVLNEKIAILEKNRIFLESLNETDLDKKLQTVSAALPSEKDFSGILAALSEAAASSGVVLGDYSFQVGDLSVSNKTTDKPAIEIILRINAGVMDSKRFLDRLSHSLPLSEVTTLRSEENSSSITTVFYYKPLPKLTLDNNRILQPLSQKDNTLIKKLSSFTSFSQQVLLQ